MTISKNILDYFDFSDLRTISDPRDGSIWCVRTYIPLTHKLPSVLVPLPQATPNITDPIEPIPQPEGYPMLDYQYFATILINGGAIHVYRLDNIEWSADCHDDGT